MFVTLCVALCGADSAEVVFQKAVSALSIQDYPAAERDFLTVLKMEPGNIGALGNLGVVYSRTHRYSLATDVYKRALKAAPSDRALSTNLGLAFLKQEQYAQALPIFEKLAADPSNLQARELVATSRLSLGQYEPALTVLQSLLEAEPDNAGVLYMQGVALTRLKRAKEAQSAFTKMMRAANPAQASFLMGKASYETENFEQAAEFFRNVLSADPAFDGVHRELGKTLISLHDDDTAEKELRLAAPEDGEALYFLGALLSQRDATEAIPLLKKARDLTPEFWGPLYYLGRIDVEQGHYDEALPLLKNAAKLRPEESAIQYQLGRALLKLGRDAQARIAFARVKEIKDKALRQEVKILSSDPR